MSSTSAAPPPQKASSQISLLPTDIARIFTHVHPALVLSAFYLRFPALVADPTAALLNSLVLLAVIQMAFAVVCLPATGSSSASKPSRKSKPGAKKTTSGSSDPSSAKPLVSSPSLLVAPDEDGICMVLIYYFFHLQTAFFALLLSLISIPLLGTIQVLFGAPITTHLPETLLSSAHVAFLAVFPLFYVHGADSAKWREVVSLYSPIDEVFGGSLGCLLGAWLGAVPIPLDWDREWQRWPVTVVTGAYAGYVLGKIVGGWVLRGRRIELD
jgi:phosphatidylinositol glycan class F